MAPSDDAPLQLKGLTRDGAMTPNLIAIATKLCPDCKLLLDLNICRISLRVDIRAMAEQLNPR
jgi:hypothetical protein